MRLLEISLRLDRLTVALRPLDADIVRLLKPALRGCPFYHETGVIADANGEHHPVPYYTQDVKAALSLPEADPALRYPLHIVSNWLQRRDDETR